MQHASPERADLVITPASALNFALPNRLYMVRRERKGKMVTIDAGSYEKPS